MFLSLSLCLAIVPFTLNAKFYEGLFMSRTKVEQASLPTRLRSQHGVPVWASICLMLGVALSRWGLWGFDLPVNQLLQVAVPDYSRGTVNGVQNSLNMLFGLAEPLMGVVVSNPASFGYITVISIFVILVALLVHGRYVDSGGYDSFGKANNLVQRDAGDKERENVDDDIREVSRHRASCSGFGIMAFFQTLGDLCR